jgi:hypothetical protein
MGDSDDTLPQAWTPTHIRCFVDGVQTKYVNIYDGINVGEEWGHMDPNLPNGRYVLDRTCRHCGSHHDVSRGLCASCEDADERRIATEGR